MNASHPTSLFAVIVSLALAVQTGALPAQSAMPGMSHDHSATPAKPTLSPATTAYIAANAKMHAQMDLKWTGNADMDFAAGMVAHHQGAIEMAQIELKYGTDPEMRKLAEEIIKAQETEIALMQKWLATKSR